LQFVTGQQAGAGVADLLGVVTFQSKLSSTPPGPFPRSEVAMPSFAGAPLHEVWSAGAAASYGSQEDIAFAQSGSLLFGTLTLRQRAGESLEAATAAAYARVFALLSARGAPYLLRVWNYLGGINRDEDGLERYRRFSLGRHDAFIAAGRKITRDAPAACALGTTSDCLVICFVASGEPGVPLENPRQVSAYRYPPQYGPRSPTFARALLHQSGERQTLFISGTASIVGHLSLHPGDARAQARETVANLRALFAQAADKGFPEQGSQRFLKVYVRHSQDLPVIRSELGQAFTQGEQIAYLQADICRSDLLLEIEGVCFAD
jgi:chorismate lyase / 3-hydroxybenzoate synthase